MLVWKGRAGKKKPPRCGSLFFTCSYWHIQLLHFTTSERRITTSRGLREHRTTHSCCDTCTVWVTSSNPQPGWPECGRGKSTGSSVSSYWSVQRPFGQAFHSQPSKTPNGRLRLWPHHTPATHARPCWSCRDRLYISSRSCDGVTWISSGGSLEPSSPRLIPQLLSAHFFFFFLSYSVFRVSVGARALLSSAFSDVLPSRRLLWDLSARGTLWWHQLVISSFPLSTADPPKTHNTHSGWCVSYLVPLRKRLLMLGFEGIRLTRLSWTTAHQELTWLRWPLWAAPVRFLPLPSQRNPAVSILEVSRTCAEEWDIFSALATANCGSSGSSVWSVGRWALRLVVVESDSTENVQIMTTLLVIFPFVDVNPRTSWVGVSLPLLSYSDSGVAKL